MLLPNIMLVGKSIELDTRPQAAFNRYHSVLTKHLGLPGDELMIGAMRLGYADTTKVENSFLRERAPLESVVHYHD